MSLISSFLSNNALENLTAIKSLVFALNFKTLSPKNLDYLIQSTYYFTPFLPRMKISFYIFLRFIIIFNVSY